MGIILTLLVGLLSALVGVFYKIAAQKNLNIFNITIISNAVSLVMLGSILIRNMQTMNEPLQITPFSCLFVILAGAVSMAGALVLQRSMIYGNSGITWAIGQSALIVPFLCITVLFHEKWDLVKVAGTIFVLCGMAVLSIKGAAQTQKSTNPKYGILLAMASFAILGLSQSMMSATSYILPPDTAGLRPVLMTFGCILAAFCGKYLLHEKGFRINRTALLIIFLMGLQVLVSNTLQFKALDLLKNDDMNGLFYPIAIGTGIAAYAVCSILAFREKANKYTIAGIAVILCGIAFYCFKDSV